MSEKTFGQRVLAITGSLDNLVEVANLCDLAYCEGTENEFGEHVPFGVENPEKVAQNLAGLQAVISGVSLLDLLGFDPYVKEETLCRIAEDNLADIESEVLLRLANCAWGAGQPFRTDKGPLGRANRLNFFDDLPEVEVRKDFHQIWAAATWLLTKLEEDESE